METETLAPHSDAGLETETSTQATETPSQDGSQPQKTEPAQVEGKDKVPQVSEARRPKGSDFYEHRDRTRRLEEAFKSQSQKMEEMAAFIKELKDSKKPVATDNKNWTEEDWKRFATEPETFLSEREKRYLDQIQRLEERLNHWDKTFTQTEQSKNIQEALELLFPKTSPDSNETLEQRVSNNPELAARVDHYLKNTALGRLFNVNPKEASELIMLKIEKEKIPNPTVLKKELMGGTARGNPGMGSQRTAPMEEKRAELKRLTAEMDANPDLRFDKDHKAKREAVMRDIERLAK